LLLLLFSSPAVVYFRSVYTMYCLHKLFTTNGAV